MKTSDLQGLYAITDSDLMPGNALFTRVEAALKGGAVVVQYRDKSDDQQRRRMEASRLLEICRRYQRPLLINDDIELAAEIGAHGVHIGQSDGSLAEARETLGDSAIIGVTCHDSPALAQQAQAGGADYVAFGAFFPSSSKPGAPSAPISLLHDARQQLRIPVVAIGGIRVDNAGQIITAGADMVAVIHSLFAADDVEATAQAFAGLFE